jgi:hypothetical protein
MGVLDELIEDLRTAAGTKEDQTFGEDVAQLGRALGSVGELGLQAGTGLFGGLLGAGAGLGQLLRDPERADVAREYARDIAGNLTYEPRTHLAQEVNRVTGEALSPLVEPLAEGLQYLDEKATEHGLDRVIDTGAVVGSPLLAAAPPRRAVGNLNLRDVSLKKAIEQAKQGKHIKRDKTGQYVGAPRGVNSPAKLGRVRRNFDDVLEDPEYAGVGADWYERAKMGIRQVAGGNKKREDLFSDESALWSAQADPGTNLGFQLRAHNEWEGGGALNPDAPVRTWQQTDEYARARYLDDRVQLGPKTGMYEKHLNPNTPPVNTGVNDIWHARNFGYTNKDGGTFSRGLSAQEHSFMDAETLLAADRANARGTGGRTDWTSGGVQAAPWVVSKGRSLAGPGGRTDAQGIALANRSPAEYMPGFTAHATYERVPGAGTGHLESLVDAPLGVRRQYSDASSWDDGTGRDILYDDMGAWVRPTNETTGYFQPHNAPPETQPAYAARPLVESVKGEHGGEIGPAGSALLDIGEATRAYLDVQNMGARHKFIPAGKGASASASKPGQSNALRLPMDRSLTPDEMLRVTAVAKKYDLSPADTGDGVTLFDETQWGDTPRSGKDIAKLWKDKKLQRELDAAVTTSDTPGAKIRGAGKLERGRVDANVSDYEEAFAQPGSGKATSQLLDTLDSTEYQGFVEKLGNSDRVKAKALELMERDEAFAKKLGDVTRADVQRARKVIATAGGNWVEALRKAMRNGTVLPAVALPLLPMLMPAGEEETPLL